MTVPLLPETAPFNAAQRAWLNGFFAGMLSRSAESPVPQQDQSASAGTVVEEETDWPWHDDTLPIDERMALTEDRPARDKLMAAMAQMDCGACGYMCRTYSDAIAQGAEADLSKCVPGGKETSRMLKSIVKSCADEIGAEANGTSSDGMTSLIVAGQSGSEADGQDPNEAYDRQNPFPAALLAVNTLNREGAAKDTRFVALDLTGSGMTYDVGDSLGVYPRNCLEHVDGLLNTLGATGNEPVRVPNGKLVPFREALEWYFTITVATDLQANLLADCATSKDEAEALRALAADDDALEKLDLWDLLMQFPSARPKPVDVATVMPALQPRLYSISSSQKMFPDEVHLTVGVVRYELNGRPRRGVASTYFAERVELGDRVRVFVQKSHGFAPPEDKATPMIMVGPGTGIAPFRAFLQERKINEAEGDNWLFFGDQRHATDFLYERELTSFQADGLLNRLDLAFSRDQEEKIYVQNRMVEQGADLWRWLKRGAHFYVCGDASRMAKDVDFALRSIVAEHGGMSFEQADRYVTEMAQTNRYQRDVY